MVRVLIPAALLIGLVLAIITTHDSGTKAILTMLSVLIALSFMDALYTLRK